MCISHSDPSSNLHRAFPLTLETQGEGSPPTMAGEQPGSADTGGVFLAGAPVRPSFGSEPPASQGLCIRDIVFTTGTLSWDPAVEKLVIDSVLP